MKLNNNKLIPFDLSLILFIFFAFSCSNINSRIDENPEKKVAELLFQKRVVMVADYGHQNSAPRYSLLKMLNEWFEIAKTSKGNHSITLILERDSNNVNDLNYFLNTGDIDSIYSAAFLYGTLEEIDFYNNLRKFKQKLDSIENKRITFHLKGFEQVLDDNFYRLSEKEGDLWFVSARDSVTASGIINYMNSNPDDNILIFYGGDHLQNGLLEKTGTPTLKYSERLGYYLAYYLKKEYGDKQVLTIGQAIADSTHFLYTALEQYKRTNILLESKLLPTDGWWEKLDSKNFDMYILRHDIFIIHPHRNNLVFSRKCIEHAIQRLNELENIGVEFETSKRIYVEILEKLFIMTGTKFENGNDLKLWYENNNFLGLKRFRKKEFADQIFNYYYSNIGNRRAMRMLNEYGLGPGVFDKPIDSTKFDRYDEKGILWQAYHNAESVFWVGYPDEKEEAKKILIQYSGQNFDKPEQYLEWNRKTNWLTDY